MEHSHPQPIMVSGTMAMIPHEFVVQGYRSDVATVHNGQHNVVREHYPCSQYTPETARQKFTNTFYAAGVRGAHVTILYRLDRLH